MPIQKDRFRLLKGAYRSPAYRLGQRVQCVLRGPGIRVCGWGDGRIPWPLGRVGHGGKGAYIITSELADAIRCESEAALCHWFGVSISTVVHWRRALGVAPFNEGTRKLYSLWKPIKLPDHSVLFSAKALREQRLGRGWTQRQLAAKLGWRSINTYQQMESGRRKRATLQTLKRLAAAFGCPVARLLKT